MLTLSQGDDAVLNLTAKMSDGSKVDLTDASFVTKVRGADNVVVSFPNDQHEANPDQIDHKGEFTLTLDEEDTASMKLGLNQEIVTTITIDAAVESFHGASQLNVLSSDPYP